MRGWDPTTETEFRTGLQRVYKDVVPYIRKITSLVIQGCSAIHPESYITRDPNER